MGRTKEAAERKLRLEKGYAKELDAALKQVGSQEAVGEMAGTNQSTVSRVLRGEPSTYDTLVRLVDVAKLPQPPLVMSKNRRHAEWCRLGAELLDRSPERFEDAMRNAETIARLVGIGDEDWSGGVRVPTQPAAIQAVKSVIASPLRTDRKRGVRRG